jgi:hypothetical protein
MLTTKPPMSNELTPQEKYRKFYEDPHLWIDAIEVVVTKTTILHSAEYYEGEKYTLTAEMLWRLSRSMQFEPLFKPQDGEAFIKDLESCLRQTVSPHLEYSETENGYYVFFSKAYNYELRVPISNISRLALLGNLDLGVAINTAAYVDTLRKIGYYL